MKLAISKNIGPTVTRTKPTEAGTTTWTVEQDGKRTLSIALRGPMKETEPIIARIVACVNACAEMKDPATEVHRLQRDSRILQQKRELDAEWGYSAYSLEVENLAADIHQRCPDPDDDHNDRCDAVHEAVDANAWVAQAPDKILEHSVNEPDNSEAAAMAGPDADWEKVRQVAAFMVMEADVYDALQGLDEHVEDRLDQLVDDVEAGDVALSVITPDGASEAGCWRVTAPCGLFIVNGDGSILDDQGVLADGPVELEDVPRKVKLAICRKLDEPRPETKAAAE